MEAGGTAARGAGVLPLPFSSALPGSFHQGTSADQSTAASVVLPPVPQQDGPDVAPLAAREDIAEAGSAPSSARSLSLRLQRPQSLSGASPTADAAAAAATALSSALSMTRSCSYSSFPAGPMIIPHKRPSQQQPMLSQLASEALQAAASRQSSIRADGDAGTLQAAASWQTSIRADSDAGSSAVAPLSAANNSTNCGSGHQLSPLTSIRADDAADSAASAAAVAPGLLPHPPLVADLAPSPPPAAATPATMPPAPPPAEAPAGGGGLAASAMRWLTGQYERAPAAAAAGGGASNSATSARPSATTASAPLATSSSGGGSSSRGAAAVAAGGPGGSAGGSAAGTAASSSGRPVVDFSDAMLSELVSSGCMSPPPNCMPGSEIGGRMAHALASLRGEVPLVRLHLHVIQQPVVKATAATAAGGSGASLTSLSAQQQLRDGGGDVPPLPPSGLSKRSVGGGSGGGEHAGLKRAVLSKLGLCGKSPEVSGERSDDDNGGGDGNGGAGGSGRPSGGGGRSGGGRSSTSEPRLVSVRFEVAGGVNLSLMSPVRKSRRTPSHEAISQIATKFKVSLCTATCTATSTAPWTITCTARVLPYPPYLCCTAPCTPPCLLPPPPPCCTLTSLPVVAPARLNVCHRLPSRVHPSTRTTAGKWGAGTAATPMTRVWGWIGRPPWRS